MIPVMILAIENDDDREYMIRLYKKYKWLLYSRIKPIVKNRQDAEDVMSEVLETIIGMLQELRTFDRDALVAYLSEMARHSAISFTRKAERKKVVYLEDYDIPNEPEAGVDELLIDRMWLDNLHLVWPSLPEDTRRILEMKYFLDAPDEEIAAAFGIKPASVRMRLTRARREVKKALAALDEIE